MTPGDRLLALAWARLAPPLAPLTAMTHRVLVLRPISVGPENRTPAVSILRSAVRLVSTT